MSVDRDLEIRLTSNLNYFSEIIEILLSEGFCFNEKGMIRSLAENDFEDYDFIDFDSFNEVKRILNKREDKGYNNYIVLFDNEDVDNSFLIQCSKLDNNNLDCKTHYDINFRIGVGKRIKGAERYTDYGVYLNRLLPIFIKHSMYVCEIKCSDYDC